MKKVIAIINDIEIQFDETSVEKGCGGSETWAIEISKEFVRQGYYVYLFSHNDIWHISNVGVEYVPIKLLGYFLNFQHIDYFLISRYIKAQTLEELRNHQERIHNNIYLVVHDIIFTIDNSFDFENIDIINKYSFFIDNINKIICMSNCGINTLNIFCKIPKEKCIVIGNGLDFSLFKNLANNKERDNNIFWSSCYERHLYILVDKILPLLKNELPDIKIRVAQYGNYLPDEILNNPDVEFLGKLSKEDLYVEMSKHKVWFYPNLFIETFCITAIEEVMSGNEIVMPFRNGPADTFKPFEKILLSNNENFELQDSIENTSRLIIDKIKNYDNNEEQRQLMRKHFIENYSWKHIVEQFTELFNKNGEA